MSFTHSFSSFVPVSLETYGRTNNHIRWIPSPLTRPLLPGSKWRWTWHRSGTQSGWRWRFVGNSREERVRGRTASASSPTLPRAVKWKMAESLPVLTRSRWVWQTPVMFIHHCPVFCLFFCFFYLAWSVCALSPGSFKFYVRGLSDGRFRMRDAQRRSQTSFWNTVCSNVIMPRVKYCFMAGGWILCRACVCVCAFLCVLVSWDEAVITLTSVNQTQSFLHWHITPAQDRRLAHREKVSVWSSHQQAEWGDIEVGQRTLCISCLHVSLCRVECMSVCVILRSCGTVGCSQKAL